MSHCGVVQEWLEAAVREKKDIQQDVVIDLCCRYGSILPVAIQWQVQRD